MRESWKYGILNDAVIKGSSNVSLNKILDDDGEYPVFGAKGFAKNVSFYQQEKEYLAIIKDGAGIGRVSKHPKKSSVLATMQYLIPKEGFDIGFVEYFLNGIDFEKHRNGSTIPHIYFKDYKTEKFPILPLAKQQRIVAFLDETFAAIAKAKANAEQNLKNSKELFESVKSEVFLRLENTFVKIQIATACIEIFAGGDAPKENFSDEKTVKYSIPIIANAVKRNGLYGYTDISRVSEPSITIAARGSGTGHTEIRYEPFFPIVRLIVLTPNIEKITLEFLKYSVQNLDILSSGSAIPQLTIPMIKEYSIALPSLKEQQIIIQKLDTLSLETAKLEAIYQQKINDLEELKKSVLQKAFSGELSTTAAIKHIQKAEVSMSKPSVKVIKISPTDLQAGIVAIAMQRHQQKNRENSFHHVKAEKIVHLAQSILNLELDRNPCKDAAGPNDFPHSKKVESRAKKAGFYNVLKKENFYEYSVGTQFQKLIDKTYLALDEKSESLNKLIDFIVPMTTQQAEIFATVYAGWNNLLIDNKTVTDEDIVTESRENWHKEKLNIDREKFFKAIIWMREKNVIPTGTGNKVFKKAPAKK
jgi:type I restriction enzyme S subunit